MSTREWKPGDVAIIPFSSTEERAIYTDDGWVTVEWPRVAAKGYQDVRPLVVIDPEDREQVAVLMGHFSRECGDIFGADGVGYMQAALREFADPTPPGPDEPTGLGAVVEDTVGRIWVFADTTRSTLRWHGEDGWRTWDELNVVRVLSEGVRGE